MRFTKMHGLGNDYVYVDCTRAPAPDPAALAPRISDRHLGVGSDGLILILPSSVADVRMRMFNVDGSEGQMCGNGIRCVAKYAWDHGLTRRNPLRVETGRGVLSLDLHLRDGRVDRVTVNMGEPILDLPRIPVDASRARQTGPHRFDLPPQASDATFVSMGNPHVVIPCDDVAGLDLERVGPAIERHPAFPQRVNAHWAQTLSPGELRMRTWERGSGATMACGTGACAACVAGVLNGRSRREVAVHLPGGELRIEWRESDGCVYMTGPATEVFSGDWPDDA